VGCYKRSPISNHPQLAAEATSFTVNVLFSKTGNRPRKVVLEANGDGGVGVPQTAI
jgi:hypothetical protein